MKKGAIVYWLVPAQDERQLFAAIVRILAKQFDAPQFEPHLTLTIAQDRPSPGKVLRQIKASPIRLKIRDVAFSAKFTKTLFVSVNSSKTLEKLVVDLSRATKSRARPMRDPHVSLLYKKISAATKKELVPAIKMPFREVVFDSIKAVRSRLPVKSHADVETWRVVATKSLLE